jgi:N-acetylgalactosamine kinase
MNVREPIYSIVLAAGKGTRMGSSSRHKVCFDIDGRPAINRALKTYTQCGLGPHIVVVGAHATQVMETTSTEQHQVIYAYQAEQRGTGHAAKQGATILQQIGHQGPVLVVAGDKVIEPMTLEKLLAVFNDTDSDLAMLVGPRSHHPGLGRVVTDETGAPLMCAELQDIRQRRALTQVRAIAAAAAASGTRSAQELRQASLAALRKEIPDDRKAKTAFGRVWNVLHSAQSLGPEELLSLVPEEDTVFHMIRSDGQHVVLPAEEVDRAPWVNLSVYLLNAPALYFALERLTADNAQQEEYLTDVIPHLVQATARQERRFHLQTVTVDDPHQVLSFNNPAELLEIESYFQEKKHPQVVQQIPLGPDFRPIIEWIKLFKALRSDPVNSAVDPGLKDKLVAIYGTDINVLKERIATYLLVLERCQEVLGDQAPVLLARSPGRINIMGRHIDHQGGHSNLMAIDREVITAAHPRGDDEVHLYNVQDELFGARQFSIGGLVAALNWDDWLSLVESERVHRMVVEAAGDWSQYIKAAVLRLQKKFTNRKFRGMDLIVYGDIPVAAGLSSSSAVVVAAAEATAAINRLSVYPRQFVDLCGEGEWFVGMRGSSADSAAMKLAEKGKVVKIKFFDFGVVDRVPFPEEYRMVVCDSLHKEDKSAHVKEVRNQRTACYLIGVTLVRKLFPQYAPLIEHLRDINTRHLRVPLAQIYKILLRLPERATREELIEFLGEEDLAPVFATHAPPENGYPIRGVVLYGLAECERGRLCIEYLRNAKVTELGRLMSTSHDGDRSASFDEEWQRIPLRHDVSNGYLLDLIEDLESGEPARVLSAQLEQQPGAYACSTPEMDLMVSIALRTEGVLGAQLAGAGVGGCIMALVHEHAVADLEAQLAQHYYHPRGLAPRVTVCTPVAGSGVLLSESRM